MIRFNEFFSFDSFYQPFKGNQMSIINTQVQPFKTQAFHNGKFVQVSNESLKGEWSVLIFMPAAFTFNCPTEVEDAADNYAEFQKAGAEVYIVTTDSHFAHKVWHETSPAVGKAKFPLVGDPTHALTNAFGVTQGFFLSFNNREFSAFVFKNVISDLLLATFSA